MKASFLRRACEKRPFNPFTIEMDSGDSYLVTHPENVLITQPKGEIVIVSRPDNDNNDDFAILDMAKISVIHVNKSKIKKTD